MAILIDHKTLKTDTFEQNSQTNTLKALTITASTSVSSAMILAGSSSNTTTEVSLFSLEGLQ